MAPAGGDAGGLGSLLPQPHGVGGRGDPVRPLFPVHGPVRPSRPGLSRMCVALLRRSTPRIG